MKEQIIEIVTLVGVIVFGAVVHATAQLKISRDKKTDFTFIDFIVLTIISAFSGMVFGLLATLLWNEQLIVILASAIGSFLGMAGLNRIANTLLDVLTQTVKK